MRSGSILAVPDAAAVLPFPTEPETLLAEAHHRIANDLALIVSLVRVQATSLALDGSMSGAEVRTLMDEMAGRILTVSRLHRLLSTAPQRGELDLGSYLGEICSALASSLSSSEQLSLSTKFAAGCTMPPDQMLPIALLVNELATNAIKYAHPTGVPGRLAIACARAPDGTLVVEVADDGVGLPDGFDPYSDGSVGLRIVRALAGQIGGRLDFNDTGMGLAIRLEVAPAGVVRFASA